MGKVHKMLLTTQPDQDQCITQDHGSACQLVSVNMNKPGFHEQLIQSLPVITYVTKLGQNGNRCIFVSSNVGDILGLNPKEMMNSTFWLSRLHPNDRRIALSRIQQNIESGGGIVQYRFKGGDDVYHWIIDQHRINYENDIPVEVIGTWIDITEQKNMFSSRGDAPEYDPMTGLMTRNFLEQRIATLEKMNFFSAEHVLCYLDIDQFKVINTTLGYDAGDALLRQLSGILKDNIGRRDLLVRLHGDEFAILLEYCSLEQARRLLENIQDTINDYRFAWTEKRVAFTMSIGIVVMNGTYKVSSTTYLSMASTACQAAKEAGRNRLQVYTEQDEQLSRRQMEMQFVEQIDRALEEDRFVLYFQRIMPLVKSGHRTIHHEVLIRMQDDEGNYITPAVILPVAEQFNLAGKIDRWVLRTFFSWLEAYAELLQQDYSWGINISGQSLGDDSLLDLIAGELERKQIPPEKIYFEITETAAISNFDCAVRFIEALKQLGCRFALDDFGSGMSSFSYLKRLPIDYVKIDGFFIKNILDDQAGFTLVKAINNIAHDLGKTTIAEFVENDAIRDKIDNIGVDYAQGYSICKPMPLAEFSLT